MTISKKAAAFLASFCMLAAAGCGSNDSSSKQDSSAPAASASDAVSSAAETSKAEESKAEESKPEESIAEVSAPEESKPDESKAEESKAEEPASEATPESTAESTEAKQLTVEDMEKYVKNILDAPTLDDAEKIIADNLPVNLEKKDEVKHEAVNEGLNKIPPLTERSYPISEAINFGEAPCLWVTVYYDEDAHKMESAWIGIKELKSYDNATNYAPFYEKYGDPIHDDSGWYLIWRDTAMGCSVFSSSDRNVMIPGTFDMAVMIGFRYEQTQ